MTITLHPEQEAWLRARVDSGEYETVEAAARQLLSERIAELSGEADEMAWAKPYVEEGLTAYARGEFLTLEEHRKRNALRREASAKE